ncbi:MAG: hypothetical protein RL291_144 [Pseudomonadota bacterium]|jgi:hypothetical protein
MTAPKPPKADREAKRLAEKNARLAKALRENLARRKARPPGADDTDQDATTAGSAKDQERK